MACHAAPIGKVIGEAEFKVAVREMRNFWELHV